MISHFREHPARGLIEAADLTHPKRTAGNPISASIQLAASLKRAIIACTASGSVVSASSELAASLKRSPFRWWPVLRGWFPRASGSRPH